MPIAFVANSEGWNQPRDGIDQDIGSIKARDEIGVHQVDMCVYVCVCVAWDVQPRQADEIDRQMDQLEGAVAV
eukprot:1130658-Pelagomonas_calceolata.AAC.3